MLMKIIRITDNEVKLMKIRRRFKDRFEIRICTDTIVSIFKDDIRDAIDCAYFNFTEYNPKWVKVFKVTRNRNIWITTFRKY